MARPGTVFQLIKPQCCSAVAASCTPVILVTIHMSQYWCVTSQKHRVPKAGLCHDKGVGSGLFFTQVPSTKTSFPFWYRAVKKVQPVLGGFDKDGYKTDRLWASAPDGTKVPMSIVYKQGLVKLDGSDPLLLNGSAHPLMSSCHIFCQQVRIASLHAANPSLFYAFISDTSRAFMCSSSCTCAALGTGHCQ